jgi:hypothetical protein
MDEIVNKVKNSNLIALDLADFKPKQEIVEFDLKKVLWQELVLKEKDFRAFVSTNDWSVYKGKVVGVHCSADAIVPTWAFMLVISKLQEEGVESYAGNTYDVAKALILNNIKSFDLSDKEDGKFIIKGCAEVPDPVLMMTELTKHLQQVASSVMYGEPCSTVPIFKRRKL